MRDTDTRPAANAVAVTPSDSTPLTVGCRSLYVGGAGNVAVRFPGQASAVTFVNVLAGTTLPVQAAYVYSTGTTATNIVALF